MKHANVSISILTYTALDACKRTLAAILPTLDGAKLILTANGNPCAADFFYNTQAEYPDTVVAVNRSNMGFVIPNNMAFDRCYTEFFVLLNDDCIPPPDWLDKLKAAFTDPKCAITGARGTCQTLDTDFIGRRGNQLDYIEASCMMIRASMMTRPLFDPAIKFAYCEDADLCLRVRERGLTIAQADFACEHRRNTTSRHIPGIRHIMADNFATCRKRWAFYLQHRRFK